MTDKKTKFELLLFLLLTVEASSLLWTNVLWWISNVSSFTSCVSSSGFDHFDEKKKNPKKTTTVSYFSEQKRWTLRSRCFSQNCSQQRQQFCLPPGADLPSVLGAFFAFLLLVVPERRTETAQLPQLRDRIRTLLCLYAVSDGSVVQRRFCSWRTESDRGQKPSFFFFFIFFPVLTTREGPEFSWKINNQIFLDAVVGGFYCEAVMEEVEGSESMSRVLIWTNSHLCVVKNGTIRYVSRYGTTVWHIAML